MTDLDIPLEPNPTRQGHQLLRLLRSAASRLENQTSPAAVKRRREILRVIGRIEALLASHQQKEQSNV